MVAWWRIRPRLLYILSALALVNTAVCSVPFPITAMLWNAQEQPATVKKDSPSTAAEAQVEPSAGSGDAPAAQE